ncbi:MAG: S41 family peptidase [Candidatus Delongbacteria bacterium]|jgi:carboxyl-terminal processing protease|nr:S41 family peptidase [Candidatus Delongbacteria bacterium]
MKRLILSIFILANLLFATEKTDYYAEMSENIKLFFDVMRTLNEQYVDTMDVEELMTNSINSMLKTLDPYTVLLDEDQASHYDELNSGNYSGIGIYIGTSGADKRLTVVSPMDDTPASRVGLRAGDRIMFIGKTSTEGMTTKDASKYLRGDDASKVTMKIERLGKSKLLKFELTREKINIKNIPYSGMLKNNVGYIKVSQFMGTTYHDFSMAMEKLIADGAQAMIIDLRYNPGGLLGSAVKLANTVIDKNKLIVSTKGRAGTKDSEYFTYLTPIDTEMPLVVLINGSSASASEILSGSLQDYDRAVIIGEPSFGKGLVQQIFNVGRLSSKSLKITVRKYFTSSGRLIQKEDYFNEYKDEKKDAPVYSSLVNKREVVSGQGIIPDIIIENTKESLYILNLKMTNKFNDFLYYFLKDNPDFEYKDIVTDELLSSFKNYINECEFKYDLKGEREIDSLFVYSEKNDYSKEIITKLNELKKEFEDQKGSDFEDNIDSIKKFLAIEFGVYTHGNQEKYKILIKNDKQIKKAVQILSRRKEYYEILGYKKR